MSTTAALTSEDFFQQVTHLLLRETLIQIDNLTASISVAVGNATRPFIIPSLPCETIHNLNTQLLKAKHSYRIAK
ncbi:MAG: hypothetical protein N2646_08595 [Bellilinea sp.]|nr:hypothetical protein [Bellilinea sp.]